MSRSLNAAVIALDGNPVGKLEATGRSYRFSYFEEYENSTNAIPISLSYPLGSTPNEYSFAGELPPFFDHLLPEGWLKEIAESAHLPMETSIEKLATLCRENIGAIEVYGPLEASTIDYASSIRFIRDVKSEQEEKTALFIQEKNVGDKISWTHCVRCHEILPSKGYNQNFHDACALKFFGIEKTPYLNVSSDTLIDIARKQLAHRESLTGVQPKFSAIFKHSRGSLVDNSFIVKPEPTFARVKDGVFYKHSAVAELAAMHFVELMELNASETAMIYLKDNQPTIVSKRFDRSHGKKNHVEDLAQALAIRDKYKGSHEKIAGILKKNPEKKEREKDLKRFLQIALLNFIIGNCDGHLKNFSIIHYFSEGHRFNLSPFYDILPIRMFASKDPNQLGLTIEGKCNNLAREHFERLAIKCGLKITLVNEYIDEIESNLDCFYEPFNLFGVPEEFVSKLINYCNDQLLLLRKAT